MKSLIIRIFFCVALPIYAEEEQPQKKIASAMELFSLGLAFGVYFIGAMVYFAPSHDH